MSEFVKDYMPDTPDINKERLELLKQECPDWFTEEGKLDLEEIKKTVDADNVKQSEQFEFTWFGKDQAKREAFTPSNATLKYDEERSINPSKANGNLFIEGENLEVMKTLLSAYREEVKCIYIDPPFNTGKDFVYSDDFGEDKKKYWEKTGTTENGIKIDTNLESSGRFHSRWLNMMYPRLLLARQFLQEDGVIFISIDDRELHHLRKICDKIFGSDNLLACFTWRTEGNFDNQAKVKKCHEYILAYCKDIEEFPAPPVIDPSIEEDSKLFKDEIRNTIVKNGPKNPISEVKLPKGFPASFKEGVVDKENDNWPKYSESARIKNGVLQNEVEVKSGWSSKELLTKFIDNNFETISDSKGQETIFEISPTGAIEIVKERNEDQSHVISVLRQLGSTQSDSLKLEEMGVYFDYPKPVKLIKYLIEMNRGKDFKVMDFFSGSGSTAHSLLELNEEDEGQRKFILIQLPESTQEGSKAEQAGFKKISNIAIKRIENVIKGYGENPDPIDSGFKVFTLDKSNFPRVEFKPDPAKSEEENVEALKEYIDEKESSMQTMFNEEDIVDEVLLKNGFMLDYSLEVQEEFEENKLYLAKDDYKEALICLDGELHEKTVEYFNGNDEQKFICLERALDTSKKWNLKNYLGDKLNAM